MTFSRFSHRSLLAALFFSSTFLGTAAADDADDEYHTPLAGEACDIECMGRKYALPERNRENTKALVLGGSLFAPNLAGTSVIPIGAFYYKHRWDDVRVRGTFSILVNDVDASKTYGSFQLLGHVDNTTIPVERKEIEGGHEVDGSEIIWGSAEGRVGVGTRWPVAPFHMDNHLRLQLFYKLGYLYSEKVSSTSPLVVLPPDTVVHGPLLRVRYDGLSRNLMELPHEGSAAGMDADFARRSHWGDATYPGAVFSKSDTQQYLKLSGYLNFAAGVPALSERNRLLFGVYGGFAPYGTLDRFSAYRIGGGPPPSETDDLNRQVFPGALFGQFPVSRYLLTSLEYRREIYSFMYLHLRGTHGWLNREVFSDPFQQFDSGSGQAVSAAITTGFLWRSQLHLEYSYDSSLLRHCGNGSNITILWSKSF